MGAYYDSDKKRKTQFDKYGGQVATGYVGFSLGVVSDQSIPSGTVETLSQKGIAFGPFNHARWVIDASQGGVTSCKVHYGRIVLRTESGDPTTDRALFVEDGVASLNIDPTAGTAETVQDIDGDPIAAYVTDIVSDGSSFDLVVQAFNR